MHEQLLISGAAVLLIAVMFVFYPRFELRAAAYQHFWVPMTSGIAIGYVFLYLLPKLGDYSVMLKTDASQGLPALGDHRIYFYGLLGFVLYYLVDQSRFRQNDQASKPLFLHGTAFFAYSLMTGDLLASMSGARPLAIIVTACALTLHLLGINHQLRAWDAPAFDRYFRWWFAGAVIVGWGVGVFFALPKELVIAITGILAGGIITNVMVEELPTGDKSKLLPFVSGVVLSIGVAVLILLFSEDAL